MADDNTVRSYRPNDPYRRSAPSGANEQSSNSDPLAELARLIGQNDPFAEFGRTNARAADPRQGQPAEPGAPRSDADWRRTGASSAYETMRVQAADEPRYDSGNSEYPSTNPYRHPTTGQGAQPNAPTEPRFEDQQSYGGYHDDPRFEHTEGPHAQANHPTYAGLPQDGYQDDAYYQHDARTTALEEELYDDPPRPRRRGALITAVVLIGCALLGTAGAYGYRIYYAKPGSNQALPVIAADKTPSKIVPAAADAQLNKRIQDRVADQGAIERLMSREEQPVTLKEPASAALPRVVLPAPVAPAQGAAPAQPDAAPAPSAASGPKRIRTVTIRPDRAAPAAQPAAGFPPAMAPAAPTPSRASAAAKPPPVAARRPAAVPARQAAARSSGPLSLDPNAQASAAADTPAPPAARTRTASAPSAPTRLTPGPVPASSGGYVVQISSQRSEAEAEASFRSLQAKYSKVLGGQQHVVRRVDLGGRGVYYRAMVGPFASAGEANELCSNLKAAGGQCLIQRN